MYDIDINQTNAKHLLAILQNSQWSCPIMNNFRCTHHPRTKVKHQLC